MVHKRNLSHLFLIFKIYMEAFLKQKPKQVITDLSHGPGKGKAISDTAIAKVPIKTDTSSSGNSKDQLIIS